MKKQQLSTLQDGARFFYGGVEWVKLHQIFDEVTALAAEPVFDRAFDKENRNDWRKSSLRPELNGPFLDALIVEGADPKAFIEFESDLTADDGMTDYGTARDKIALISCEIYRRYRTLIPKIEHFWPTLTPWTCTPEHANTVRHARADGMLTDYYANSCGGIRPLCHLWSLLEVNIPAEEEEQQEIVAGACDALLETLNDYPAEVWGAALGAAVAGIFKAKLTAQEMAEEEQAKRKIIKEIEAPEGMF